MKLAFAVFLAVVTSALPVLAALGDTEASVETDRQRLQARAKSSVNRNYTVHEMTRDDGTVINEYVSSAGKVFGVSWQSPTIPDLSQLLGSNFSTYQAELNKRGARRARRSVPVIESGDLVVESAGHQRFYHGRAYLNSLIPAGASEAVIQ